MEPPASSSDRSVAKGATRPERKPTWYDTTGILRPADSRTFKYRKALFEVMEVRRTAVVKLNLSDEQRDALHRTAEQYLYCANRTADYCWSDTSYTECKTNKREVRDALYSELREETDLQAQLVQAAIKRAVEAVKGVIERWKKGQRISCPTFTAETMDYDARSAEEVGWGSLHIG
jgi:predicted transposase